MESGKETFIKEYKFNTKSNGFRCVYGPTNIENKSTIFIKLISWAKYNDEDIKNFPGDLQDMILEVKARMKMEVRRTGLFDITFIYTPSAKKTLAKSNKPFFADFEFTLKLKDGAIDDLSAIQGVIEEIANNITSKIESYKIFDFSPTKKRLDRPEWT